MVRYIKQSDIEVYPNRCFSANLSAAYSDAFDNSQPTADISNLPYKSGLFVEMPTSQTPPYGSGEAVGYKLGIYVNDITVSNYDNPTLTIWKAKRGITNNQGNFGQTVVRDIYAMCSYPSYSGDAFFTESFDDIKGGTRQRSGPGGQAIVSTGDYYVVAQHIFALKDKLAVRGHWKGDYTSWLDYWGSQLPNGLWVVYCDLGSKYGDSKYHRRKEWRLLDPNPGAPNPREGKNTHGYLAWDEGWGGGDAKLNGDGIDGEVRINIDVKNTYEMNYRMEGIVAKEIDPTLTNFYSIEMQPVGTLMRFSDSEGDQELMQNGIFKDFKASRSSALFNSLAGVDIVNSDDAWSSEFQTVGAGGNGFLQVNCVTEDQIPMPVQLTMTHPRSSTQEQTSTAVDGIDTTVTLEIKTMSEICAKSDSHAVFPSRGIAVWFKNHINAGKESKPNVLEDMYVNFYQENAGTTTANYVGMADGVGTAVSDNVFCGYFLYKYNSNYYVKSIGKEDGSYGTSLAGNAVAEVGGDMVPFNVKFDPDDTTSGSGCTRLNFNPQGKLLHIHHRWTPGASNGFELIFEDVSTGVILNDEIHIPTTHGGSPNDEYAMPYFSFATYNCASVGKGGSNINHRPLFNGYSDASEHVVGDNIVTQVEVSVDEISTATYGLSYTHSNATITTDGLGGKMTIASRDGPDMSVTLSKNDKRAQISESETRSEQMHPTYLSFGFKTSDELKMANGGGKYLYFSGFMCANNSGNAQIADSNMKWAWSTDATPLGKQLADNTGTNIDAGTMSSANSQFAIGTNLFFSSTGDNAQDPGPNPTSILINENFTQKGFMYIKEADFTDHSKRENIFCSARVMGGYGRSNSGDSLSTAKVQDIIVNSPDIFTKWKSDDVGDDSETYCIYIYGKPNKPCYKRTGLILKGAEEVGETGGYGQMTFNKDVRFSDAYMAVSGASKTIQSDSLAGDDSDKELTFVNPKIGGTGSVIDLRDYFKPGDEITLANTSANNYNFTIASIDNATQITLTAGLPGGDFSPDADATMKHRAGYPDLLVHTIGDSRYDDFYFTFVSPEKYWIFGEIYNYDEDGTSLPMKQYDSVILTDFRMDSDSVGSADFTTDDLGASYNEFTVTDGIVDINEWNLTGGAAGGVLESSEDYGHGAYNWDEQGGGGYVAKWVPELSFDRSAQYNLIDISGYPVVPAGESIYLWAFPQQEGSTSTTNVGTFNNTDNSKRPFLLTIYEDQIPAHPKLSVKPYEEDGFIPQFSWDSSEDDLWYGLLFIDNSQINNQYHNYLYYIPLNEDLTGYADNQYTGNIFLDRHDGTMSNPSDYLFTETASINSTARVIHTADSRIVDGVSVSGDGIPEGCYVDVVGSTAFDLRDDPDTHDTLVNATKTIGSGGSGHTLTFGGTAEDRYDGLAGHSKRFSNATGNILKWTGAQTGVGNGNKFSFLCHVVPDRGAITEETYIAYQNSTINNDVDYSWFLALDTQGRVKLSIQGQYNSTNSNTVTELTSASIIPRDNESPTMICWTLDNELVGSNVKLFINGILEASSGLLATGNTNSTNQWGTDVLIDTSSSDFYVGGYHTSAIGESPGKADKAFSGKIEEIVAYSDVVYPVNPKDGQFIWRKPVKDFTGDKATPLSYVSRLFIKDYHNIRGRSTSDVAVSSPVSYMKPVLGNRGD